MILIMAGILLAGVFTILINRLLWRYLNDTGYFVAMMPRVTEVYDTKDFQMIATTSAQGIRNPRVSDKKQKGSVRILALGDSQTYGWGVAEQDAWPRVLETKLLQWGVIAEIINAGAPGASLSNEWRICEAYRRRFDVDMVVLGLYVPDDLYQGAQEESTKKINFSRARMADRIIVRLWDGRDQPGSTIDIKNFWKFVVREASIQDPLLIAALDPLVRDDVVEGRLNPVFTGVISGDPQYFMKLFEDALYQRAISNTTMWLTKIRECAGGRLLVVLIPSAPLVSESFFPNLTSLGFEVDKRLVTVDWDRPLRSAIERIGTMYVSTVPVLRNGPCDDCFYPWDIHLTPMGHDRVAGVVFKAITEGFLSKE